MENLTNKPGPFDIFEKFRNLLGVNPESDSFFSKLFGCLECFSVWTGLLSLTYFIPGGWGLLIILIFASSGIQLFLDKYFYNG